MGLSRRGAAIISLSHLTIMTSAWELYNDGFFIELRLVESEGKIHFMETHGTNFWVLCIQHQSLGFWVAVIGVVHRGVDFSSVVLGLSFCTCARNPYSSLGSQ